MSAIHHDWEAESVSSSSSTFSFCRLTSSRDIKIEVPEMGFGCRDAKRQSYPLPLPPGSSLRASPPNSAAKSREERGQSEWKKGRLIYRGKLGGILGDVYCGFNSEKGGMCAIKEIPFSSDGDKKQSSKMLEKEIALLSHMSHPNIVQYYGSQTVADKFYIYYEFMARGTISMILEQYGRLGESAIRSYTREILSGLAYLHSNGIVHGDIKGANVLIDPNGRVKLSNFGIEKQIAEKFRISWLRDSPYWMAPEVIMNPNVRNIGVDIWSLGCTILEMATAKPPLSQYDGAMAILKIAYGEEVPTIPDHLSDVCKDFLRNCLCWNPVYRATVYQLLAHPFMREQILVPTSSVGIHQQLSRRASPIQFPHRESFSDYPKQSPNSNSPAYAYWDPNILRGMLRFS